MLRPVLVFLALALLVSVVVVHRRELPRIAVAAASADPGWLGAAAALQLAASAALAELHRRALGSANVAVGFRAAWATSMGALGANLLAPSAGAAGAALWVDRLTRRGAGASAVIAGVTLAAACDLGALTVLVLVTFAHAAATRGLGAVEVAAAVLLVANVALLVVLLVLAARRPERIARMLAWVHRGIRRVAPRSRLAADADGPRRHAALAAEAASGVLARRGRLAGVFAWGLAEHVASLGALGALCAAFGHPLAPLAVVSSYAVTLLVWIMAPVPQGIGVVEILLAALLLGNGLSPAQAPLVAVAFRALTFWIPLLAGFLLLSRAELVRAR